MKISAPGWPLLGVIAVLLTLWFALGYLPAAIVDGAFIPLGYDSFYHAVRIRSVVEAPHTLIQFDPAMMFPEGFALAWPAAYDGMIGLAVRAAAAVFQPANWEHLLGWVGPFFGLVNALLATLILRQLGLQGWRALTLLIGVVTVGWWSNYHAFGNLDHHAAQLSFGLAALLGQLHWQATPERRVPALGVGAALGFALGVHHELVLLALPVAAWLGLRWWTHTLPKANTVLCFAASLLVSALLVSLPNTAFWALDGRYDQPGWLAPYLLAITAAFSVLLAYGPPRRAATVASWIALSLLALAPVLGQILGALRFMQGDYPLLSDVMEARSGLHEYIRSPLSSFRNHGLWPLLGLILPLAMLHASMREFLKPNATIALLWLAFGWLMFAGQQRFYYELLPGALLACALLLQTPSIASRWVFALAAVGSVGQLGLAVSARQAPLLPGTDFLYANVRGLLNVMAQSCDREPGSVLAPPDLGHFLRWHTRCEVWMANLINGKEDVRRLEAAEAVYALAPADMARLERPPHYVIYLSRRFGGPNAIEAGADERSLEDIDLNALGDRVERMYTMNLTHPQQPPHALAVVLKIEPPP